jgi:DNA-binding NtrC family response regulator
MLCLTARYKGEAVRFPVSGKGARLGAGVENEFVIPFPGVSRVHAHLAREGSEVVLRDAGSRNGIHVGGLRVEEVRLKRGDTVQIGRAVLILDEAPTSEFEVGIKLTPIPRRSAEGRPSTAVGLDSGVSSPAAGMRLIREMEGRGESLSLRLPEVLAHLRTVLDADAVVLAGLVKEEISILGGAGALPPLHSFDGLKVGEASDRGPARVSPNPDGGTRAASGWTDEHGGRALIAFYGPSSHLVPSWQQELISYVASRLAGASAVPVRQATPPTLDELRIPEGMVVGESASMRRLLDQVRATVRSRMDVLLTGETGTGKEFFARLIHDSGLYAAGPFVAINCAAIPAHLLESQLFGIHGRIATGVDAHSGLLVQAEGGAIFLDEIGELAETLQAKLLRFLQEREIQAVGASTPRKIDVLVISSSNRDLGDAVRKGTFRADLFYRLRGLQFHIPPLRERKEDISGLVLAIASQAAEESGKRISGVSRKAVSLLVAYDWPGNIRELQSEVRRAVLVCPSGSLLMPDHFGPVKWAVEKAGAGEVKTPSHPPTPEPAKTASPPDLPPSGTKLQEQIEAVERKAIQDALAATGGNKSKAAEMLGVTRAGLAMKMRRLLGS